MKNFNSIHFLTGQEMNQNTPLYGMPLTMERKTFSSLYHYMLNSPKFFVATTQYISLLHEKEEWSNIIPLRSRMKLFMLLFQVFPVDMSINLSGGNICMTEHLLHRTQISSPFKQMCCE